MSFSMKRGHPNCLEPRKRPAHTLNTFIVSDDNGNPQLIGGTPGADDQVQTNLQVLVNILDLHLDVQEAIEAPRWSSKPGTLPRNENDQYELHLENRFSQDVFARLSKKGHEVRLVEPWSIGGLQIIQLNSANGIISAGADPRRDGYAVGF